MFQDVLWRHGRVPREYTGEMVEYTQGEAFISQSYQSHRAVTDN